MAQQKISKPFTVKRFLVILSMVIVLLSIPLIIMQVSNGINWGFEDFLVMGILLLSSALLIDLVLRRITGKWVKITIVLVILAIFLIIWGELAVGIFGTPFAGS